MNAAKGEILIVMKLLDYLFYRVYSFYSQKNDNTPIFMGCLVLSVLLFFNLLAIVIIVSILKKESIIIPKWLIVVIGTLLPVIFYYRYRENDVLSQLKNDYSKYTDHQNKIRGWLIVIYVVLSIIIVPAYSYLKHNLGMNI